ncbi:MAG TPA: hypothetical protein VFE58_00850 [Tepidisphaeraceae bacterium]|jgi:LSD1 subclass zinc finger protein|nr:hypothetical protein [Tepidisphaeraceae bacterium]
MPDPIASTEKQFPCKSCGASLRFAPGTTALTCPYCHTLNQIARDLSSGPVQELDYQQAVADLADHEPTEEVLAVHCTVCGAESNLGANVTADVCPFCGSAIVATTTSKKQIRPRSLLPFNITKEQSQASFRDWIGGLWFAPSALSKQAEAGSLKGIYLPAWTYDAGTDTDYTGERGDDYWDTETYTETVNGQTVTRTREVRRTRWHFVSGSVTDSFDDVLVMAASNLPEKHLNALEPWDLDHLVPYQDEFLSGFVSQSYQVTLADGFQKARQIMDVTIRQSIESDIGGDHQRIATANTQYHDITFKHILLPVWLSAYRYNAKTYHFFINARTGEVRGERPYSPWKITFLVVAILIVILVAFAISQR